MRNSTLDGTDRALIAALRRRPRAGITELARVLGAARNTVQARLRRLEERGVITGHGPDVDPRAAGYEVTAFTTLMISQGSFDSTVDALESIPEVLEVHTIAGRGDLLLRLVAETNDHLHDVLQTIAAIPSVVRTDSQLSLHCSVNRTVADLLAGADRRAGEPSKERQGDDATGLRRP